MKSNKYNLVAENTQSAIVEMLDTECLTFQNVFWKNTPNLKNIMLKQDDVDLKRIVENGENGWNKII